MCRNSLIAAGKKARVNDASRANRYVLPVGAAVRRHSLRF